MPHDHDRVGSETVAHLTAMYEEHSGSASPIQRGANRLTAFLGRPACSAAIIGVMVFYIVGNLAARSLGSISLERLPFPDLQLIATVTALTVALLILTTQRHEEQLSERRARLTLQIAAISERKIAKVIALLEEQRRDNPLIEDRRDDEAASMASSAHSAGTLQQIDDATAREG